MNQILGVKITIAFLAVMAQLHIAKLLEPLAPMVISNLTWLIPVELAIWLLIEFAPSWLDMWAENKTEREIEKVEGSYPGMRATTFGKNKDILLTEKATGAAFRELKRGRDF